MANYNKMADQALKQAGIKIVDNKALSPNPRAAMDYITKKKDKAFIKKADRKLKGFKFGVGTGP